MCIATSIHDCRLLELPQIPRPEGSITPAETGVHVPFEIQRVYYVYDIPAGAERGGHAHRALQQMIVCALGSFTVVVRDGREERWIALNRPHVALYIPQMIWRDIRAFSGGSICVVLASEHYEEGDYVRDYGEFKTLKVASNLL
jgi:dTDP-4-dehydrorhamnose 3,5-epimerase-like enzyme